MSEPEPDKMSEPEQTTAKWVQQLASPLPTVLEKQLQTSEVSVLKLHGQGEEPSHALFAGLG